MSGALIPAPTAGWNARDNYAEMEPNHAISLINMVPAGDKIKTRPGYAPYSNDLGAEVETLVTYHGTTEKMLCAAGGAITDITAGGDGTDLATGFISDRWQTTEFSNRIIFCNGEDSVRDYDGTTLNTTTITGVTSADLIHCVTHKGRVYYTEVDSSSFWYAAEGAYSGALTEFDLSQFTRRGGSLLYCVSWTRDGGSGVDDLFAAVCDTGEVIVYGGSDPDIPTDWYQVGVFVIGNPLGRRSATKIGGDVIILTVDGYVPLSAALQEGRYSEQSNFSYFIDPAAKQAAQTYADNFGWQAVHWPQASWFVVNIPISGSESIQHTRNTSKGAWCKFTGYNALCWTEYDENLYYGSPDGYVYKVGGASDNGAYIPYEAVSAFNYLGNPHEKKLLTSIMPITNFAFPTYFSVNCHFDYTIKPLGAFAAPPEPESAEWNIAVWDVAKWLSEATARNPVRRNLVGMGYAFAVSLRFKARAQTVTWWASHLWWKPAGIV